MRHEIVGKRSGEERYASLFGIQYDTNPSELAGSERYFKLRLKTVRFCQVGCFRTCYQTKIDSRYLICRALRGRMSYLMAGKFTSARAVSIYRQNAPLL